MKRSLIRFGEQFVCITHDCQAIVAGVATMVFMQAAGGDRGWGAVTPALGGLLAAIAVWAVGLAFGSLLNTNQRRTLST